jgi:hypothetical protein
MAELSAQTFYDKDYCLWLEITARQLKNKQLSQVDWQNLIEEIECMGRSERSALTSNLVIVLMHLLKYQYQPDRRSNSWRYTLIEHRRRLREALKTSPSLKRYLTEVFQECYQDARRAAAAETGLAIDLFPVDCPYTPEATLNADFLPE